MTIRNTFTASASNDVNTLRRASSSAFQGMVTQLNAQQIVAKSGATLPSNPVEGQLFLLTATDGSNTAGFYGYDGTNWLKLS